MGAVLSEKAPRSWQTLCKTCGSRPGGCMRPHNHDHVYFESHFLESEEDKDFKLIEMIKARQGNAVVYCATPNAVDYVHDYLSAHGIETLRYHKRLRASLRQNAVSVFGQAKSAVLIAAAPIDEDLSGVRLIVHFNYPVSMSDYLNETRFAGGDGKPSRCSLLYLRKDKRTQKRDPEELRKVMKYAQSAMCRVQLLARHLGQDDEQCHRCDNCLKTPRSRPVEEKKRIDLDALLEASLSPREGSPAF